MSFIAQWDPTWLAIGFVLGFIANRTAHLLRACWLDKHRPRPDGRPRSKWQAVSVDARAAAALVMLVAVGWSVYKTQENADTSARITADAKAFAEKTSACQDVLIEAIAGSRETSNAYNAESEKQRQTLALWVRTVFQPPPEIAALPADSLQRQAWVNGITAAYFGQLEQSQREQAAAAATRPPLPKCSG